ncbi:MAG: GMC family oxidoreductase N-terminal domain-containing protein, partial [Rhizobacter sp.]|nr:GMC family oxidoreductase N-terminal domain-containing protein [Rhizobacter sp.]
LMLSGIGPAAQLRSHGIAVRVDLPGVGENLQDRYEVALTHRMRRPWRVLEGATFKRGDPLWRRWSESRAGMYASNGAAVALIGKSAPTRPEPDLFCMALLARFEGYRPGFSELIGGPGEMLTWAILKAHTENRAGNVRLRSADPRDVPLVDFRYFEEGSDAAAEDLAAVVAGVRFVRSLTAPLIASGTIAEELAPGAAVAGDAQIAQYVRDTAWGHHASGSCAIGADGDVNAVLDGTFRVRGTRGLRVVDASVFPRIPGFFIASAVYMAAEKAADAILDDARVSAHERAPTTPS